MTELLLVGAILVHVHCGQWERDYSGHWRAVHADVVLGEPEVHDGFTHLGEYEVSFNKVIVKQSPTLDEFCWCAMDGGQSNCNEDHG